MYRWRLDRMTSSFGSFEVGLPPIVIPRGL